MATVVVAAALVIGAVVLVGIVERSLTEEVRTSLRARAGDLVALAAAGAEPGQLVTARTEDALVQVLGSDGTVLAASAELIGEPRVANLAPGRWVETGIPNDDERFLVTAVDAGPDGERVRILVGRTLEPVAEATALVGGLLAIGLPIVLMLVAAVTWFVVGRSLAPVERMRREVDAISGSELHRRVVAPPTDDEISRLAGTMNRMLDRLEASQARQRQLVADTSHELRSPIASIRQQAELAAAHPDRVELGPMGASVLADAKRLQGLIDDLLLLARADERRLDASHTAVDLDDLVFDEVRSLRSGASRAIDVSGVGAARVIGDEAALRRLVRNLLDNALRHATTSVTVALQSDGGDAVLRVDDDGEGIASKDRARVFERFVRLDTARARATGGAGLGLAIVAAVASAHRGSIAVDDAATGGARFEVRLPLAPPDA